MASRLPPSEPCSAAPGSVPMCDEYQPAPRVRKDAKSREQLGIQYLSRSFFSYLRSRQNMWRRLEDSSWKGRCDFPISLELNVHTGASAERWTYQYLNVINVLVDYLMKLRCQEMFFPMICQIQEFSILGLPCRVCANSPARMHSKSKTLRNQAIKSAET